ncbi:HprK-related kinase A [Pseudorhodoferax sp.]|uniref:HprK-related kinase A n=1 Tax=Pseudorhodoferax sp. TaxID=1993553 RepID=UPI002DD6669A|nr:HprK-related kinase A [Pseudorhodoferax sp.]
MRLGDLSDASLRDALGGEGVILATGPFRCRIASRTRGVFRGLRLLYPDFEVLDDGFCDFSIRVDRVKGLRGYWRPQISFYLDGFEPFKPLAADHAYPLLEWGMNWCIAGHAHHYLLLHAAVLERNGRAVVLPGEPGAGKSTLTAALALSGYRLLSDEMTIIDRDTGLLVPLTRPVSLKNKSIDIVRAFSPDAVLGEVAHDTHKGSVAHLRPPPASVANAHVHAMPAFVVHPRWQEGSEAVLTPHEKSDAFMRTAGHAFNYEVLGSTGFDLMAGLIDRCECYDFRYSRLPDAIAMFDALTQ